MHRQPAPRRLTSKIIVAGSITAALLATSASIASAASASAAGGTTPPASGAVAAPATGGVGFSDPPVIQQIACRKLCSAAASVRARKANSVVVRETGRIAIKGRKLSDTTTVVFLGGAGSADDVSIAPLKFGATSLTVDVPTTAGNGSIQLIDAKGQASRASRQALVVLHYKKTSGGLVFGEKPPVERRTDTSEVLRWPVNGPITSPFGPRWGRMHNGIDIGVPSGTPIHAAAAGRVIMASSQGGYGNFTCLKHVTIITCYAHQSAFKTTVGAYVQKGEVIGLVGNTGHSFGAHLHFEVRTGDLSGVYSATPVNAVPYLPARGSFSSYTPGRPMDFDLPLTEIVNGS